jgi:hypothetical protein
MNFFSNEDSRKHRRGEPGDTEAADEEDVRFKWNTLLIGCTAQMKEK